jgi:hypothetical protein
VHAVILCVHAHLVPALYEDPASLRADDCTYIHTYIHTKAEEFRTKFDSVFREATLRLRADIEIRPTLSPPLT